MGEGGGGAGGGRGLGKHTHTHTLSHSGEQQSQARHSERRPGLLTHLGVAAEEAIRDGDVDVEGQRLQDADLRGEQLLLPVRVVANVQEVVDAGRIALLRARQSEGTGGGDKAEGMKRGFRQKQATVDTITQRRMAKPNICC